MTSEFFTLEYNTIDRWKACLMGYLLFYKKCVGVCMGPWLGLLNAYVTAALDISIHKKIMQLEGLKGSRDQRDSL